MSICSIFAKKSLEPDDSLVMILMRGGNLHFEWYRTSLKQGVTKSINFLPTHPSLPILVGIVLSMMIAHSIL